MTLDTKNNLKSGIEFSQPYFSSPNLQFKPLNESITNHTT